MDRTIIVVTVLFVSLIIGVVAFSWWIAFAMGLWQISIGILSGCLLVAIYNYVRLVVGKH
jgi:hypothetical protein